MASRQRDIRLEILADIKKSLRDLKKFDQEGLEPLEKRGSQTISTFRGMGAAISGFIGVLAIREVAEFATEISRLDGENQNLRRSMANLAAKEGVDVAIVMRQLRDATRGTLSDISLMRKATLGKFLGIDLQNMPTLLEFARQRAKETGEAVEFLAESLVTGIGRRSILRLDNLGITMDQVRQEVRNILEETGKWTGAISDNVLQMHFQEAAIRVAKRGIQESGDQVDTTTDKMDRMNARLENVKAALGGLAARVTGVPLEAFGGALAFIERKLTDTTDDLRRQKIEIGGLVGQLIRFSEQESLTTRETEERKRVINLLNSEYGNYFRNVNLDILKSGELRTLLAQINSEIRTRIAIAAAEDETAAALSRVVDTQKALNDATRERARAEEIVRRANNITIDQYAGVTEVIRNQKNAALQFLEEVGRKGELTLQDSPETVRRALQQTREYYAGQIDDLKKNERELAESKERELKIYERFEATLKTLLGRIGNVAASGSASNSPEVERQKEIAELIARLRLEALVLGAKDEFDARRIQLEAQYAEELRLAKGNQAAIEQVEATHQARLRALAEETTEHAKREAEKRLANEARERPRRLQAAFSDIQRSLGGTEAEFRERRKAIDRELEEGSKAWKDAIEELGRDIELFNNSLLAGTVRSVGNIIESTFTGLAASLVDSATTGSEAWSDFFDNLKQQITEFLVSNAVKALLNIFVNLLFPGAGLGNLFGSAFNLGAGGRANPGIAGGGGGNLTLSPPGGGNLSLGGLAAPSLPAGGARISTSQSTERILERIVAVEVESIFPDANRVRTHLQDINRSVLIPDQRYVSEHLETKKSEFDE